MSNFYLVRIGWLSVLLFSSWCSYAENKDQDVLSLLELDMVSQVNPLGLALTVNGYYRQVYNHDASPLWDGLYYQAGAQAHVNPAFSRAGVHLEWLPVTVLKLRLQYDRYYFSGSNGSLLAFSSADELFGDNALEMREGDEFSGYGDRSLFRFELRLKHSNVIFRNVTDLAYYRFPGAGPYYLEREYEILMATRDDTVSNQMFLLFETSNNDSRYYIGPYYDYVSVSKSGLKRERLGLTGYQTFKRTLAGLKDVRWFIQAGTYLDERNRDGELYLIAGIGGDFKL